MTFSSNPFWAQHEEELRRLWDEGVTTAEIGRRLGITKNAVVGKAHRLMLTPRPAPVVKVADGRFERRYSGGTPKPVTATGATAPALAVVPKATEPLAAAAAELLQPAQEPTMQPASPPVLEVAAEAAAKCAPPDTLDTPKPLVPPTPIRPAHQAEECSRGRCRWPMWANSERAGRPQRFCTTPRVPGWSYCARHCSKAYTNWLMVEDAA